MSWRPLFDELKREQSGDALHEGVPGHLQNAVEEWIKSRLTIPKTGLSKRGLSDIEVNCRIPLDWSSVQAKTLRAWNSLVAAMRQEPRQALEVANYLLSRLREGHSDTQRLERVLAEGGSAWRATDDGGTPHLERRVLEEVQQRYDEVSTEGRAGEHLRLAWQVMYRQNPSAGEAYDHAVKAVEVAGRPIISPENNKTTLGTMIRDFNAKRDKWSVPLGGDPNQGRLALVTMMQGVWHGHLRHGDEAKPIEVSLPEAEAALHTALTLVHLFGAGLVSRNS